MHFRHSTGSVALALFIAACGAGGDATNDANDEGNTASTTVTTSPEPAPTTSTPAAEEPIPEGETTVEQVQYTVTEAGSGDQPQSGDIVQVHYRGTLEDGTEFDSSYSRGEPISFLLGVGQVIAGWDQGIQMMKVGEKGVLTIPPSLAYGEAGAGGGIIPPNATLVFEVELVSILAGPPDAPTAVAEADYTTTASGLKFYDFETGTGDSPESGDLVTVHYTGWLEDGTMFDSSLSRGTPFQFTIGLGQVIAGWDEGVASMMPGTKRQLVIPAELGYGDAGAGNAIPPNAVLVFEVELISVGG